MVLTLLTIMTAGPIYANNFSLNMQVYRGELLDSSEETHKQLIGEAYGVSAVMMTILFILMIVLRLITKEFWVIRERILDFTQGVQAFCFGIGCIALPLIVQASRTNSNIKKTFYCFSFVISMCGFALILVQPIFETYYILNK